MSDRNLLACNLGSYGRHRANAYAHLHSLGVHHVEIPVPAADQVAAVAAQLLEHELTVSTLMAPCDVFSEAGVAALAACLPQVERLGVTTVFVSVKQGEASKEEAYARLRAMGEAAAGHGVTLAVETHPEFAQNAATALATLRAVDHPNVRLNFDTGNIYFYNEGVDAVRELEQVAPYVAAVHLKDTNGGYRAWHFPALGEGIVDFPAVFRLLNARGFTGPFTMELEGIQGESLTEPEQLARVASSVAYLRRSGLVP
jgi:L-ribulose-5-phosphate 3-epimerase